MKTILTTSAIALILSGCAAKPDATLATQIDNIVALPSQNIGMAGDVIATAIMGFAQTGPGESLRILDIADGTTVTSILVGDQKRFESQKFKRQEYASELGRLQSFVRNANDLPLIDYTAFESDVLSVFRSVGMIRSGEDGPTDLLLVAGGLQQTPDNPSTSMYSDGRALVASDTLLTGDLIASTYGIGDDRDDLQGVDVYFCPVLPVKLTGYELQEISRMWGHVVASRGGRLMAFTPDINLCLEQFKSGSSEPIPLRVLDDQIEQAMIRADKSGKIKQITATEAEIHRKEIDRITADRDRERLEREAAEREAKAAKNKPPVIVTKTIYEDGARFTNAKHTTLRGVQVSTGVEYSQEAPHGYINAWCYMHYRNARGAKFSIDIGSQIAGQSPKFNASHRATLQAAGINERDFLASRSACQFPAR